MRRFELLLLFGEVFAVAWPAVFGVRLRRGIVPALLLILFALQWRIEGLRWQLIPIYGTALGLGVGDTITVERTVDWTSRIARGVFGLAGVGLAAVLPLMFPVPTLPVPSGSQAIGTRTIQLVDSQREELYGPAPGGPRQLMVQVWYPAREGSGAGRALWSDDWDVVAPAMARLAGWPGWFFDQTRFVYSDAAESAPVAEGTFPVVLYSHEWTGFRSIAINQMESLASHGYIVIAPDHTYAAVATRFEDGTVAQYDPTALPDPASVTDLEYETATETLMDVYAGDLTSILDALESGETGPFGDLANSADLSRVGIYGHREGGGAAIRVCLQDERCDAVLGLDPWVEALPDQIISETATKPALYMRSDEWRGTENDAVLRGIAERSEARSYWVGVDGADSNDFVAIPLVSPIADNLGWKGPIPTGRVISIIDRYLVGFFDVALLDTGPAALDTASFDEVTVEVIQPG